MADINSANKQSFLNCTIEAYIREFKKSKIANIQVSEFDDIGQGN